MAMNGISTSYTGEQRAAGWCDVATGKSEIHPGAHALSVNGRPR